MHFETFEGSLPVILQKSLMSFESRLQNAVCAVSLALIVEGTANVKKTNTVTVLARTANWLSAAQMLFFLGYGNEQLSEGIRIFMYSSGQLCGMLSDIALFYILWHITDVLNITHNQIQLYMNKSLLFLSVICEFIYKYLAVNYYINVIFKTHSSSNSAWLLFSKGVWACMFMASALLQFFVIVKNMKNTSPELYWSLVLRSTKSAIVIWVLAVAMTISATPLMNEIPDITQSMTNPAGLAIKAQVCLSVLVRVISSTEALGASHRPANKVSI